MRGGLKRFSKVLEQAGNNTVCDRTNGGKDKIKTELVICGNVVRHAVSFRVKEMACSEQESVKAQTWSEN